jgi:hypothetical protein
LSWAKVSLGILVIILLTIAGLFAEPVNLELATNVANMKITIKGKTDYTIEDVFELKDEDGTILSYVFSLDPKGYIAISTDTDITPVIAYSFRNDFVAEDIPQNIAYQMLKRDMQLRLSAIPLLAEEHKDKNNLSWEKYEKGDVSFFSGKGRGIWPTPGTTTTGGWVETRWNQNPSPYWDMCPLDPEHGGKCYVGCVATAMAQIVNYHRYIDDANFDDSDDYNSTETDPWIHIDDDWQDLDFPSFPTLNIYLDEIRAVYLTNDALSNYLIAALSFACGVATHMQYTSNDGSGTQLIQIRNALLNKFDYDSAVFYYSSYSNFYPTLQSNMMNALPAALGIGSTSGGPGHAIICDGYNSDEDPVTYHLNFGWGGSGDNWYTLPDEFPQGMNVVNNGVMNIQGGDLPYLEIEATSLTELSGDGDDVINPGESANLRIRLSNRPSFATATDVAGILRCSDPRVTIIDSLGSWNDILPGSSAINITNPFTVEFADGIGACTIDFTLHITSNSVYNPDLPFEVDVTLNQAGWPFEVINGVSGGPALVDIDGNGELDVVFADKNGDVHCRDKSGNELSGFPVNTGSQIDGSPAIADINGDSQLNIVVSSRSSKVYVLNSDGSTLFTYDASSYIWCTPVISDIDNNGSKEIIFGTIDKKVYVINSLGANYPNFPITLPSLMYSGIGVAVADINDDGTKEIIVGCMDGNVYCINSNADTVWIAETSGVIHSAPTIVELDGTYKILVGSSTGKLYIISSEGDIENEIPLDGDIQTSPVVVNLDSNPVLGFDDLAIIVGTGAGNLYVLNWDGTPLSEEWPYSAGGSIESTPIVADINNDGIFDIIFGSTDKNLYILNASAQPLSNFPIDCGYEVKSPSAIDDIDGDGDYEIVFGTGGGLWMIDYKEAYNPDADVWPMYRFNLERTGYVDSIPTYNVSVEDNMTQYKYFLGQNFPNPFSSSTAVSFSATTCPPTGGDLHGLTRIMIYNIKGQIVKTFRIPNSELRTPNIVWDGIDKNGKRLSNGIYLYRLETDKYKSKIKKMVLLR